MKLIRIGIAAAIPGFLLLSACGGLPPFAPPTLPIAPSPTSPALDPKPVMYYSSNAGRIYPYLYNEATPRMSTIQPESATSPRGLYKALAAHPSKNTSSDFKLAISVP